MIMPTHRTAIRHAAATMAAACLLGGNALATITVVQDVNSGRPPKDIMVVFDKTDKDAKSFKAVDKKGNAQFSFAEDSALQIKITRLGSDLSFPFPKEMDIAKATYILLTAKVEGQTRTQWQGDWRPWQPYTGAKMWWSASIADADGTRCAGWANLDAVSPGGFLPVETKTVIIPAMFFTKTGEGWGDPARSAAFMILIGEQRETAEREFTLTIDRISIAE